MFSKEEVSQKLAETAGLQKSTIGGAIALYSAAVDEYQKLNYPNGSSSEEFMTWFHQSAEMLRLTVQGMETKRRFQRKP